MDAVTFRLKREDILIQVWIVRQPARLAHWLSDPQLCQVVQLLETDLSDQQSCQYLGILLDSKLNALLTPVVERIVSIGHPGYCEIWDAPKRSQAALAGEPWCVRPRLLHILTCAGNNPLQDQEHFEEPVEL